MRFAAAVGLLGLANGCGRPPPQTAGEAAAVIPSQVSTDLTGYDIRRIRPQKTPLAEGFQHMREAAVGDKRRVAVLFSADWCQACRRLELEFGSMHAPGVIDDVRILEFVEEDWEAATRMDEVHELRRRWYPRFDNYPVMILLDANGDKIEEMEEAIARLKAAQLEPSMANWFVSARDQLGA